MFAMASKWKWAVGASLLLLGGCLEGAHENDQGGNLEAQQGFGMGGPMMGMGGMGFGGEGGGLAAFADEIGVTATEKTRIKAALDSLHHRLFAAHKRGAKPTFAEMKAHRAAMRDSTWAVIMGILTPDQQAKATAIRDSIENGQKAGPGTLARVARLTKKLGLDSTQKASITSILTQSQATIKQAADSATSFDDLKARMTAVRADVDAKITAVLTADQAKQFAAMMQERGKHGRGDHGRGHGGWGRGRWG